MHAWLSRLTKMHRFCIEQLIYPLVLSSSFACALYAGRVYLSHRRILFILIWNLFLAWIPYLCSLAIMVLQVRRPQARWALLLLTGVWLIFFPNAPYLVMDLLHLEERRPVPLWYDFGLLISFAWTGCLLGVVSLNQMQVVVKKHLGNAFSWLFVLGTLGLSGLGIYLGRFLDWNSWDLILRPQSVLSDIAMRLVHPVQYQQTYGFALLFAALLLVCYVTFVSIGHRLGEQVEN
ncbi:MAG: DUF1361 domain-containing protein [Acidobacteriota bacterium]